MNRKLFTVNNTIRFFFLLFIFSAPHPAAAIPVQHSSSRLRSPVSPQTRLHSTLSPAPFPFSFHFRFVLSRFFLYFADDDDNCHSWNSLKFIYRIFAFAYCTRTCCCCCCCLCLFVCLFSFLIANAAAIAKMHLRPQKKSNWLFVNCNGLWQECACNESQSEFGVCVCVCECVRVCALEAVHGAAAPPTPTPPSTQVKNEQRELPVPFTRGVNRFCLARARDANTRCECVSVRLCVERGVRAAVGDGTCSKSNNNNNKRQRFSAEALQKATNWQRRHIVRAVFDLRAGKRPKMFFSVRFSSLLFCFFFVFFLFWL